MKNSLKLIRILMLRSKASIFIAITFSILGLGLIIMSALIAEPPGNPDYLISITATSMGYALIYLFFIFALIGFSTRFFFACPNAEYIITRAFPFFTFILSLSLTAFSVILHFISRAADIAEPQRLSDFLLISAFSVFIGQLSSGFMGLKSSLICAYGSFIPFIAVSFSQMLNTSSQMSDIFTNGFGIPTHISALIFVSALALSTFLSLFFAKRSYKKRTSNLMNVRLG